MPVHLTAEGGGARTRSSSASLRTWLGFGSLESLVVVVVVILLYDGGEQILYCSMQTRILPRRESRDGRAHAAPIWPSWIVGQLIWVLPCKVSFYYMYEYYELCTFYQRSSAVPLASCRYF